MHYREHIQQAVYALIDKPVALLVRAGVKPNHITLCSLLGVCAAAALMSVGDNPRLAGVLVLAFSALDMVDGYMARTHNLQTRFGAFLDSITDRYSELAIIAAMGFFTSQHLLAYAAILGAFMVSYARARAEALGQQCKVGLLQRPERVVLLAAGCITADPLYMQAALALVATLANITAIWRIGYVWKSLSSEKKDGEAHPS